MPNNKHDQIRLATYNIHRCIGADGRALPERILAVLEEMNPDVIALQELEQHPDPALNLLDYFAHRTGLTAVAGPTILNPESRYGNALLTALPVRATRRIDLTVPGREPRGALDMDLDWHGRKLHLIATHLGLNPAERRRQIRLLLNLIEKEDADLTVLMGDLNEWFLWGRTLRWLNHEFPVSQRRRTFPASWPLFALDRIWVYPSSALASLSVHDSRLARIASDHLPLTAVLEMAD